MVYSFPDAYWMLIKISSLALIVGIRIDGIELVASYQLHLFIIYQWENLHKNLNTIALTRLHFFMQQKKKRSPKSDMGQIVRKIAVAIRSMYI